MNAQMSGLIVFLCFPLTYHAQRQDDTESSCSMAGIAVLIMLLILLLGVIAFCSILLWRRKEIKLFGWIFKLEREKENNLVITGETKTQTDKSRNSISFSTSTQSERSSEIERGNNIFHLNSGYEQEFSADPSKKCKHRECRIANERESLYENQVLEHERTFIRSNRYREDSTSLSSSNQSEDESENTFSSYPGNIHDSRKTESKQNEKPGLCVQTGRSCYVNQVLEHERNTMVSYEDLKIDPVQADKSEYEGLKL
uniref:Uncharacterized protein LOC111115656 isoform X1 n=1 Tax=Crassostrea virginica TaxID=6565 RepID=A0A8B8C3C1_CRAVI|nr:uncharacterized protein LOC111115656 isoform X1 [Crassostrea virginica]